MSYYDKLQAIKNSEARFCMVRTVLSTLRSSSVEKEIIENDCTSNSTGKTLDIISSEDTVDSDSVDLKEDLELLPINMKFNPNPSSLGCSGNESNIKLLCPKCKEEVDQLIDLKAKMCTFGINHESNPSLSNVVQNTTKNFNKTNNLTDTPSTIPRNVNFEEFLKDIKTWNLDTIAPTKEKQCFVNDDTEKRLFFIEMEIAQIKCDLAQLKSQ